MPREKKKLAEAGTIFSGWIFLKEAGPMNEEPVSDGIEELSGEGEILDAAPGFDEDEAGPDESSDDAERETGPGTVGDDEVRLDRNDDADGR